MKEFKTVQEACDYAVSKIVEQGGMCYVEGEGCAYGDGLGNHCAIGWLLDPQDDELMGFGVDVLGALKIHTAKIPNLVLQNSTTFLSLQQFHDSRYKISRGESLDNLSKTIDTTPPQYQQWVDMGE